MHPRTLSRWTLGATLFLIALGGFTRGSGSGYGCEDQWPLCQDGLLGGLLPRLEFAMIVEWTHRWVAAIVGLLAILTALAAWRRARRWVAWVAIGAVGVIGIQAWVGRLIVTNNLDADLVSLHLAISMTVALLMTVTVVATTPLSRGRLDRIWIGWLVLASALSAAVLMLGSLVHNVYVPGWPLTLDEWIPDLGARTIAIHFFHRVAAAASFGVTAWVFWRARRDGRPATEVVLTGTALGLVALNVALGAVHVFTSVEWSWLVATHLGVASVALVALVAAVTVAAGGALDEERNEAVAAAT
jgi:cytochrome c oxidase assembly protein subunit 15